MPHFEVFDLSILHQLQIGAWSEDDTFAELLSASTTTVTSDGHLVLWDEPTDSSLRITVFDAINGTWEEKGHLLGSAFHLNLFYGGTFWRGRHLHLERFTYTTEKLPEVFGNWEDQQPGYTTLTIISNKRTLDRLFDKWKLCLSHAAAHENSAFCVADSGAAVQANFYCEEVRIEDVIDFYVAAAFAIQKERKSRMILGRSYTEAVASSEKKKPYTGKLILPSYSYPDVTMVTSTVESKYGPFKRVWPQE